MKSTYEIMQRVAQAAIEAGKIEDGRITESENEDKFGLFADASEEDRIISRRKAEARAMEKAVREAAPALMPLEIAEKILPFIERIHEASDLSIVRKNFHDIKMPIHKLLAETFFFESCFRGIPSPTLSFEKSDAAE